LLLLALVARGWPLVAQGLTLRDSALHALNRLAHGPRPGEVERVAEMGVMNWIERQLAPEQIADPELARREQDFEILRLDAGELGEMYAEALRQRRQALRRGDTTALQEARSMRRGRRLMGDLQQLAVVRAATSERQLFEVMADFWTNHFNVFYAKRLNRVFTPDYVEHTIRPHALGKFEDLLVATAKSPAMLFYLDNVQSVAPGSSPPGPLSAMRRRGAKARPRGGGLNENYARELLELHTLGVDGGYTQDDVVNVARIFTGWSVARPGEGTGFVFREWAHDNGEKQVLSVRFQGDGMQEGVRLLEMLADHHATLHHVSRKLCARFVADDPPDGCVDAAVDAWHHSGGDIQAVLRAIFRSPDFWAPQYQRIKVKTPLEFVVGAVRAVGGEPDATPRLAQVVARLGQPLYLQPVPTGYAESQEEWVNAGALLNRINVAVALAAGRLPGVQVDLDRVVPLPTTHVPRPTPHAPLTDVVNERILAGTMSEHTKAVISRQLSAVSSPVEARAFAVGLAIGGPEFQRQ
jgi:uncharacterized protein (DUF1800 family)